MEREQLKTEVWQILKDAIFVQADGRIKKEELTLETNALSVFPTHKSPHPYTDELANAYGIAIMRTWVYLNVEYNLNLKMDYEVRKEFELFPTFSDAVRYIFGNFGPILIGGGSK